MKFERRSSLRIVLVLVLVAITGFGARQGVAMAQARGAASLEIHIAECQAGYPGGEAIYNDCHGMGVADKWIAVSSDSGFEDSAATIVPESLGPGVASFSGLPPGNYSVDIALPAEENFSLFCTDANQFEVPVSYDPIAQTLSLAIGSDDAIVCDWYQIPAMTDSAGSTLELHVAQCAADTDPESDLYVACHDNGIAGVDVEINDLDFEFSDEQTADVPVSPGPGIVRWDGLAQDRYEIRLSGYDPSSSLVPFCTEIGTQTAAPFRMHPSYTGIVLYVTANTNVVCDFYVMPPDTSGTTLQLSVFNCPATLDASSATPIGTFQEQCTPFGRGGWYTLTRSGQPGVTLVPGDDPMGVVVFGGLENGNYTLMTSIPGEFNDSWVFCGIAGTELIPYASGSSRTHPLSIDVMQGPYACEWFNVPETFKG